MWKKFKSRENVNNPVYLISLDINYYTLTFKLLINHFCLTSFKILNHGISIIITLKKLLLTFKSIKSPLEEFFLLYIYYTKEMTEKKLIT